MINSSSSSSSNPFLKSQAEGRLTTRTSRRRHRRTTSKSRLSRASRTWSGPSREARAPSTKIEAVETTIPRSTATVTMKSFLNRPSHQYRSLPISIKSQGKKKNRELSERCYHRLPYCGKKQVMEQFECYFKIESTITLKQLKIERDMLTKKPKMNE